MIFAFIEIIQQSPALAKQVAPNIYVTVQSATGIPEWVKILASASVGAAFGIASSLLMEFVKPWIARRHALKTMIPQLNEELLKNINQFENAEKTMNVQGHDRHQRVLLANLILKTLVRSDRFDYFFANEKSLVYDYDQDLITIYRTISKVLPTVVANENDEGVAMMITAIAETARAFAKRHNLQPGQ